VVWDILTGVPAAAGSQLAQLKVSCCKIRITTTQCAIDKNKRAIAATAPDGGQLASALIPDPLNVHIVQWRILPQPMHGTAFTTRIDDLR
jgi:hypothetical protein